MVSFSDNSGSCKVQIHYVQWIIPLTLWNRDGDPLGQRAAEHFQVVVRLEWALECARERVLVSPDPYIIETTADNYV